MRGAGQEGLQFFHVRRQLRGSTLSPPREIFLVHGEENIMDGTRDGGHEGRDAGHNHGLQSGDSFAEGVEGRVGEGQMGKSGGHGPLQLTAEVEELVDGGHHHLLAVRWRANHLSGLIVRRHHLLTLGAKELHALEDIAGHGLAEVGVNARHVHFAGDCLDETVALLFGGRTTGGGEHQINRIKQPRQGPGQKGCFQRQKRLP